MGRFIWQEKDYSTLELGLSCVNLMPYNLRLQAGDIVVCRPAFGYIGFKEAKQFFWLHIENTDTSQCSQYHDIITQTWEGHEREPMDKRRYCIPFHRLEKVYPSINFNRLSDLDDPYQPFFQLGKSQGQNRPVGLPIIEDHRHILWQIEKI